MARGFRLTPRAYRDLLEIARYSRDTWGTEQRDRYLGALDQRFGWLAENPHSGKHRPDIAEGFYCFPQGRHLIFYLIQSDVIDIIGIPHRRMDVIEYFDE